MAKTPDIQILTVGQVVTYRDAGRITTGHIVALNEDGTVDLVYPHPANESIEASAYRVAEGTGGFQFERATA